MDRKKEILSASDVAKIMGVSVPTVRLWWNKGVLPYVEWGIQRRISRAMLERWYREKFGADLPETRAE